ncbi:ead/Ea22-like family protein [Escherichia coli]|uniref:ead/Ea22-like family protein n=5 Tax=Escherichia coli TaxID=562 RepID=UPI0012964A59|nr:ead/Ea22-like family protein [Escherichia coli]NVB29453.1 ead/Ea22-like family protein [Escherichia coli]HBA4366548.1 ead/Ea22-like family protein [Escherichia coli]HBA4372194.1 ead/Ea22-like family protein [Escherichia coli]
MSKIDYQALREAAEQATKGSYIVGHTSGNQHGNITGVFVCQKWKGEPGGVIAECHVNCLVETDVQAYANAEFIAAFNPNVALALLDERDALNERLAELEADLAGLAEDHQKATESIKQADAAVKLAHEKFSALAAENAMLKQRTQQLIDIISNTDNDYCMCGSAMKDHVHSGCGYPTGMFDYYYNQWLESDNKTPATDAFLAEVRAQAHKEGAHFVANRMLAAWEAGFIEDTAKNAADIARMILTSTEFMDDAPEGDFDRSFADGVLEDIAAQIRKGDAQ